jgi:hypothetical protein
MPSIDVAALKEHAEELFAKAAAGKATMIEQNGQRALLVPCNDATPDFELYPEVDALISERLKGSAHEPTEKDWDALRKRALNRK